MTPEEYLRLLRSETIDKELPFDLKEYRGRVTKVREEMGKNGIDALVVCTPANLNYLTGYSTFSPTNFTGLILPLEGEPSVVTAECEIPAVILSGWVEDVQPFFWRERDKLANLLVDLLNQKGLSGRNIGLELILGEPMTRLTEELRITMPNATFVDASTIVERVRVIKSSQELKYMKRAGQMTCQGINDSLQSAKAGVTDTEVARVGHESLIGAGSEFMSVSPVVTTGQRSSWHHTTFRRVPIKLGDPVFLEYSACYMRYNAPMMRTAIIGTPSDEIKRLGEAVKDTLELVIQGAKGGRTVHEVAMEAQKGYAGLESEIWFMGIYGYSVGIGFPPTWADGTTIIAEGIDEPLLPGMTFHLPIMFRIPRKFGIGLSETIAITETGCEVLTEQHRDLYIAQG